MIHLDELLFKLDIPLQKNSRYYYGCCPIHCGDNPQAINLYIEGDFVPGYWKCNTRNCEMTFKKNILGFIRGCLSSKKGWTKPGDKVVPWNDTIAFATKFLKVNLNEIQVDEKAEALASFTRSVNCVFKNVTSNSKLLKREDVRKHLKIPSEYFLARKVPIEILEEYDVGDYIYSGKPLSNRAVVPIYDEDNRYVVGFTGRWIGDHEKDGMCKWFNHKFSRDSVLYNWGFARKFIEETRSINLVEGPGEIWKLRQLNINNNLALLGKSLSDTQQILLEKSGAMKINICLNNDKAGQEGAGRIIEQLKRSFRLKNIVPIAKDIAESDDDWIRDNLK